MVLQLATGVLYDIDAVGRAAQKADPRCDQLLQACISEVILKLESKLSEMSGLDASRVLFAYRYLQINPKTCCPGFTTSLVQYVADKEGLEEIPATIEAIAYLQGHERAHVIDDFLNQLRATYLTYLDCHTARTWPPNTQGIKSLVHTLAMLKGEASDHLGPASSN